MEQADIIFPGYDKEDCEITTTQFCYVGDNYEEEIDHETGTTTQYHYIRGSTGLAAVFTANDDSAHTDNLYYIHQDYLGSILCLSDEEGNPVERYSFDAWGHRRNPAKWSQWQEDSTGFVINRGFTEHEHMDLFGLINMNGRIYDPDLGRFLSPDPYVQMPDNSQNFNRYSYALNNPLKYTDPSGEFFVEAIMLGMYINTAIQGATGNIQSGGDFFKAMTVGALSGIAGGFAGQAVAGVVGTIGFAGGAMTGGAAGFSGGFITGAGNSWMGGANFGDGLVSGLRTGAIGGLTGGVIGGISGGITATRYGGNFWSGEGATFDALATHVAGDNIEIGEGMDYSNDYARKFSDDYFGKNINGLKELRADGTIPNGYSTRGDVVLNRAGQQVRGSTVYLGTGKRSNVLLYKAAFTSKEQLYFTMGHEYLHVAYNHAGVGHTKALKRAKHASIYKWEAYQAKAWGFKEAAYARRYLANKQYYNAAYDYSKFDFFVLSTKPW